MIELRGDQFTGHTQRRHVIVVIVVVVPVAVDMRGVDQVIGVVQIPMAAAANRADFLPDNRDKVRGGRTDRTGPHGLIRGVAPQGFAAAAGLMHVRGNDEVIQCRDVLGVSKCISGCRASIAVIAVHVGVRVLRAEPARVILQACRSVGDCRLTNRSRLSNGRANERPEQGD